MTGIAAGETVRIRDDEGNVLFTYRSFASVIGIVAALVASIVVMAGIAATLFLCDGAQRRDGNRGAGAERLLRARDRDARAADQRDAVQRLLPALTIAQKSRSNVPSVTFTVVTPDGAAVGTFRKSIFSRLGRNRWRI